MPAKTKPEMPDFLVQNGDGSLSPLKSEKAVQEAPQPAAPAAPEETPPQATPSAGNVPDKPTGGNAGTPTGGSKPTMSQELAGSLPLQPSQRGKDVKTAESGGAAVAKALAPQLGTAPEFLVRQMIDERKFAVLNDLTQTSLNYLSFRGYVDKLRFWAWFVDAELVTSQAIGGLARQHVLRAIEGASGSSVTEVARKPGVLARNVWERDWKKQAIRTGKVLPAEEEIS